MRFGSVTLEIRGAEREPVDCTPQAKSVKPRRHAGGVRSATVPSLVVLALVGPALRGAMRRPAYWLLLAVALMAWRGLETFLPLGIVTQGLHRSVGQYQVVFIAGIAAMLLVLEPLAQLSPMLRPQRAMVRTAAEGLALLSVAAVVAVVVLLPVHAFDLWQYADFDVSRALTALTLGWLHAATLFAAIVLRPPSHGPVPPATLRFRAAAATLAVLVVPGLMVGSGGLSRAVLFWLDAGGILRAAFDFPLSSAHWIQSLLPIVGWGALAAARATPAAAPPRAHALRHPR